MGEPHLPRVNLPDTVPRKPLVPGQNSWAQQQQQHEARQRNSTGDSIDDTRAINRDRYENKPMPPTPPADEGLSPGSSLLQPKAYIQPAIPLFPPPFRAPTPKMRAVTDPVPPKPLFASRKVSVKQLRKKYSQTKGKDETSNEGLLDDNQPSPTIPVASEKAAQVLGISSAPDNGRKTPRTSAPTMSAPAAFRTSNEGSQEQTVPPTRQVQSSPVPERSTPVPTRRYLKENGLQAPAPTEAANASKQVASEPEQSEVGLFDRANATKSQNTFLHPARIGTHMNVGEVGLVEGAGMHRVESFRGVIEDVPSSTSSNGQMYTNSYATSSQPSTGRDHGPRDPLPPNAYSPSNYGGVWENDPAVVSSTESNNYQRACFDLNRAILSLRLHRCQKIDLPVETSRAIIILRWRSHTLAQVSIQLGAHNTLRIVPPIIRPPFLQPTLGRRTDLTETLSRHQVLLLQRFFRPAGRNIRTSTLCRRRLKTSRTLNEPGH